MPAQRPRASFEPIPPEFDLKRLVESTPNFSYVDRISCDMIDAQGLPAFEKLILLHVIIGGKPLVIDGFEDRLDPWTFTPKWLRDNCGDKHENARNLTSKENLPLTMGHYLKNMGMLTNQFFGADKAQAYREPKRQRVYLKDIDCPTVWQDKLREHIPSALYYLNESTGDVGGPGAVPDPNSTVPGRRLGKGIGRAGDLMSSLPPDMRAENLMCYIGHEGTYTPAHREMCASLGQNIMVEASSTVSEDGKAERPGSSIWFMTESKDRHTVSEYWLSVLGHDIEVENHFAQVVAWKKAPFNVYVVEQRPGDFILIPPLAPHQVWNRGTRTMKVAWNRTTVETLEMALNEALPRSRIVCRDEQYKNKAIIYYTLQKYSALLSLAQTQAARLPSQQDAHTLLTSAKIKQLTKDFKRLFGLYRQVLLSEMFDPDIAPPKQIEYLPFDSNVTCAYCRGNVFNRFLTCPSCKDMLGHSVGDGEGDPYDVCMDCYAMGRSCACISGLKWVEQFRWKELAAKYETWRKLVIALDGGRITDKTPLTLVEERKKLAKKTLAEVCREQLKRRPWKDVHKANGKDEEKSDNGEEEEEEIVVNDDGTVKSVKKKKSKAWLKNNSSCHVCCKRHPNWKMAQCTTCERMWCYGTLYRGWDKLPNEIMEDPNWTCPHCLGICFAGACKREGKMTPYEPKGTLLGHDTKKVADARSVEALVDFSVSNMNWLKDDEPSAQSKRLKRVEAEAERAKAVDPTLEVEDDDGGLSVDESRVVFEGDEPDTPLDPALGGSRGYQDENMLARRLQQANEAASPRRAPEAQMGSGAPDGYAPLGHAGYVPPAANMYPQPDEANGSYAYPGYVRPSSVGPMRDGSEEMVDGLRPFKRRRTGNEEDDDEFGDEGISMAKHPKAKKPRLSAAGFRSTDLAEGVAPSSVKTGTHGQFEKEKEKRALERARSEGRFIMLQAALRGKRRVVRLPIPAPRLAQVLAQLAAKAALMAGEEADAEHEVEEGAAADQPDPHIIDADEEPVDLLKSDITPKKKQNPNEYYQQRQKEGFMVSGATKKAMIPVEKDTSYGHYPSKLKAKPGAPQQNGKKARGMSKGNVEYEEVDIGSDDDFEDGEFMMSGALAGPTSNQRRSLPSYLQNRVEDEDAPYELPAHYRDHGRKRGPRSGQVEKSKASPTTPTTAKAKTKPTAGKRPSMRPSTNNMNIDGAADDTSTTNGDYIDVDDIVPEVARASSVTFNGTPTSTLASRPGSSSRPTPKAQPAKTNAQQRTMNEQNRLAKLQALEMVTGDASPPPARKAARPMRSSSTGKGTISMAEALDQDSDDDDGIEEVPARGSIRV